MRPVLFTNLLISSSSTSYFKIKEILIRKRWPCRLNRISDFTSEKCVNHIPNFLLQWKFLISVLLSIWYKFKRVLSSTKCSKNFQITTSQIVLHYKIIYAALNCPIINSQLANDWYADSLELFVLSHDIY